MAQKLLTYLNEAIAEVSDKEVVLSEDTKFATLGLDSYDAMSFIARLKEDFEDLPVTIFLQCQTTTDLIKYLENNHKEEMEELWKQD
ncbi:MULTISPECIES: acyl carrier protein [Halobacteriovorax]|uniref:Acyl carrier protein n=1 Tax=Halobacteriovorax vibrionivorans TaxID=2152716 RepID=A0ABY0IED4_9BACT|nr:MULTISPECIES: acyl carrier protein [Halobacteriovorax]AYF44164.1 phosphopantetheine attachment domain protein [Halobacteriovorax sp. BALOs_7]RZF21313.1 acyl carrier protein [Halobacteriovorax vibrionivorans]TGD47929.1 acyl carrier protein [Halobacteriovorax sp. Y22]